MNWLMLMLAIAFTASANLVLKLHGSESESPASASDAAGGFISLIGSQRHRLAGLFLLAAAFVVYARALESIEVSLAYPVMTGSVVVLVTVLAAVLFEESVTPLRFAGLTLLILGVGAVARS